MWCTPQVPLRTNALTFQVVEGDTCLRFKFKSLEDLPSVGGAASWKVMPHAQGSLYPVMMRRQKFHLLLLVGNISKDNPDPIVLPKFR